MMGIGYVGIPLGVQDTGLKSCTIENVSEGGLMEIISHNLNSLENIIDYNHRNGIRLFQISWDLIPFGESPVDSFPWWEICREDLARIKMKLQQARIRILMHPGKSVLLCSPDEEVLLQAVLELNHRSDFLDSLGGSFANKIVLHVGETIDGKKEAMERFIRNCSRLESPVRQRLAIENDSSSWHVADVLKISEALQVPVVFNNHHHRINPAPVLKEESEWIRACALTWKENDGPPIIRYSQKESASEGSSPAESIAIEDFLAFYQDLDPGLDLLLDVRDRNLSAVKCINCTTPALNIKLLEMEWSKYKYSVLENSHRAYQEIRELLKDKKGYPAVPFYLLVESALTRRNREGFVNAAQHVWGYFKYKATKQEKDLFLKVLGEYRQGNSTMEAIKEMLWELTIRYEEKYLMDSYYFFL